MDAALSGVSLWTLGLAASVVAGVSTGLGALPVFARPRHDERTVAAMLGFGAGVMMAATAFSLLVPALEAVHAEAAGGGLAVVIAGTLAGGALVALAERVLPHQHALKGREGGGAIVVRGAWLFVFAIAVHNVPEGLAVGVAFAGGDVGNGLAITVGIALQNLPEGLVAALALVAAGYRPRVGFAVAALTGLVETVGGVLGLAAVTLVAPLVPFALAFAAGAMLYVISHEVIPESHRPGVERLATAAVMVGFVLMMGLDTMFA